MDTQKVHQILRETTQEFRKGEVVVEHDREGVHVKEVYAMPHESEADSNLRRVDCHFITVGVNMEAASKRKGELLQLLDDYPFPDRLAEGPSYIEIGGELGSQDAALRLFALGEALELWEVITPEKLGINGPEADELAGGGMVMMSGYKHS